MAIGHRPATGMMCIVVSVCMGLRQTHTASVGWHREMFGQRKRYELSPVPFTTAYKISSALWLDRQIATTYVYGCTCIFMSDAYSTEHFERIHQKRSDLQAGRTLEKSLIHKGFAAPERLSKSSNHIWIVWPFLQAMSQRASPKPMELGCLCTIGY